MKAPLAAWGKQPVHHQNLQHLVPARAFTNRRQALEPKLIQFQLSPQLQCQPAPAPLPRPLQPHLREPQAHNRLIDRNALTAIFRK